MTYPGFSPNGMAMDLLRSCYTQPMRYVADDPSITVPATWYFCKPGAKVFPLPHRYGSGVWDTKHPSPSILGFDDTQKRVYYQGDPLNSSDGTDYAGPAYAFMYGQQPSDTLARATDGTPLECLPPPYGAYGGGSSGPPPLLPPGVPACLPPPQWPATIMLTYGFVPVGPGPTVPLTTVAATWDGTFTGPFNLYSGAYVANVTMLGRPYTVAYGCRGTGGPFEPYFSAVFGTGPLPDSQIFTAGTGVMGTRPNRTDIRGGTGFPTIDVLEPYEYVQTCNMRET